MRPQAASPIAELFDFELWSRWLSELDRGFIFLLVLPFVVALVGLWSTYRDDGGDAEQDDERQ